jgi:hypothetical protein
LSQFGHRHLSPQKKKVFVSTPYNFSFQHELEASYIGALLTSKSFYLIILSFFSINIHFFFIYSFLFFFYSPLFKGLTTFERIAAYRAFCTQMDALLNNFSPDDEYSVIPPEPFLTLLFSAQWAPRGRPIHAFGPTR